jgi:hypothetical protein
MPRLLISDANILIDMFCGALLDRMFRLPYDASSPRSVSVDCGAQVLAAAAARPPDS